MVAQQIQESRFKKRTLRLKGLVAKSGYLEAEGRRKDCGISLDLENMSFPLVDYICNRSQIVLQYISAMTSAIRQRAITRKSPEKCAKESSDRAGSLMARPLAEGQASHPTSPPLSPRRRRAGVSIAAPGPHPFSISQITTAPGIQLEPARQHSVHTARSEARVNRGRKEREVEARKGAQGGDGQGGRGTFSQYMGSKSFVTGRRLN
ncbi:hypothetical protein FIBSPDRAFT_1023585 [Athelia psychrophila]|uniref:Uncharacterized protein n=1 Tax=Athelia psychrophila TaxID=1759441 RepID=A0A166URA3_9AGAM|nr:hypothetical protein FIBSPDRAFT_1023585 [Fibularhizoctonia sp. CBS 109695]